ncbi:MAG: hypothetical protein NT091_02845 [Candidatus Falkowbacteria bacterium]|nr:hypothetical protein [Candidatus Falkowbacteria bacterium]
MNNIPKNIFNKKRQNIIPILTATAISFGALMGGIDNANSAEATPKALWTKGLDILKKNIAESDHLARGVFVLDAKQKGHWIGYGEDYQAVEPITEYLEKNPNDNTLCYITTVPKEVAAKKAGLSKENLPETLSFPPSNGDVADVDEFGAIEQAFENGNNMQFATIGPNGLWYYDKADNNNNKKENLKPALERLKDMSEARNEYINKSKDSSPIELYEKLQNAYNNIGIKVRFVSYEDLAKEPPCAGVDYKPNW